MRVVGSLLYIYLFIFLNGRKQNTLDTITMLRSCLLFPPYHQEASERVSDASTH